MPKMSIYFSGSDMVWEDTAHFLDLGATKRHNLRDVNAAHYYYFFDGPAASSSPEHKPVQYIEFDESEKSDDFMRTTGTRTGYNIVKHLYDLAHGSGMDHVVRAAYRIIELGIKKGITEFDLVGFSRGGCATLSVGALIKNLEKKYPKDVIDKIKVNIIAIDPVAGLSRNKSANVYGSISPLVKNCIVGLAVNESLPGFEPRDIMARDKAYNVKFHPTTQYAFLPLPEDHLMTNLWMKDVVRRYLPENSELRSPCKERLLIERRLGLTGIEWADKFGETAGFRMVRYFDDKHAADEKHMPKYQRNIFPEDEKQNINLRAGIEEYFKHIKSEHLQVSVGHTSLQNDADSEVRDRVYRVASGEVVKIGHAHPEFMLAQVTSANKNQDPFCRAVFRSRDRSVKERLTRYTNYLFANLLHESMFQKFYPNLHRFLLNWNVNDLDQALIEYRQISKKEYPLTKENIKNALEKGMRLKPIESFKSTSVKSLGDVLKIAANLDGLESKEHKIDEVKAVYEPGSEMGAYCFANILVMASDKEAIALFKNHSRNYFTKLGHYSILYKVYKEHEKKVLKEFMEVSGGRLSGSYATKFASTVPLSRGSVVEVGVEMKADAALDSADKSRYKC